MIGRRYSKKRAAHRGFSLIELMMVISILSLISSIVMASMVTARERAREAKAKVEMRQIIEVTLVATGENNTTVIGITEPNHLEPSQSTAECLGWGEVEPYDEGGPCYDAWKHMALELGSHSDNFIAADTFFISFKFDPWGTPYIIHERQGLYGHEDTCDDHDEIKSAGADRIHGTDDDVSMEIPLSSSCP